MGGISDAILGKRGKLYLHTADGDIDLASITKAFDDNASKDPVEIQLMGHMDPSYIPDTGCKKTGTITILDRDGSFDKFYKEKIVNQKLEDTYPKMSMELITKYNTGVEKIDKYDDVILNSKARRFEGDTAVEYTINFVATLLT